MLNCVGTEVAACGLRSPTRASLVLDGTQANLRARHELTSAARGASLSEEPAGFGLEPSCRGCESDDWEVTLTLDRVDLKRRIQVQGMQQVTASVQSSRLRGVPLLTLQGQSQSQDDLETRILVGSATHAG